MTLLAFHFYFFFSNFAFYKTHLRKLSHLITPIPNTYRLVNRMKKHSGGFHLHLHFIFKFSSKDGVWSRTTRIYRDRRVLRPNIIPRPSFRYFTICYASLPFWKTSTNLTDVSKGQVGQCLSKRKAGLASCFKYHTRIIITPGLYISYLLFEDNFFVFKEFFSENSVLMY